MPTPVTHIVFAEKIYEKYFKSKDEKEFYIGTCFPDIRRNAGLERYRTHMVGLKLKDFYSDSPFYTGFKTHCLIDEIRKKYFRKNYIYNLAPDGNYEHVVHASKILEDKMHYDKFVQWKKIIDYLDTILDEQIEFGVDKKIIKNWHSILQEYFSKRPDKDSVKVLFGGVGYNDLDCENINNLVERMESNHEFISKLDKFYSSFEDILNDWAGEVV